MINIKKIPVTCGRCFCQFSVGPNVKHLQQVFCPKCGHAMIATIFKYGEQVWEKDLEFVNAVEPDE